MVTLSALSFIARVVIRHSAYQNVDNCQITRLYPRVVPEETRQNLLNYYLTSSLTNRGLVEKSRSRHESGGRQLL